MTQYANDYFDRHGDVLSQRTPYSGGSGVLVEGLLSPDIALRAALICAALGSCGALLLATVLAAPAAALLAVAIALGAWAYSAPPLRLLARGLGECDTALVVAILVPLCAFCAQRGTPTLLALCTTLPGACAMLAMMFAVEFPDLTADAASGKRNLLVRLGPLRAKPLALAAAGGAYAVLPLVLAAGAPRQFALVELLSLPLGAAYAVAAAAWRHPQFKADARFAAIGVTFFLSVIVFGAVGYAVAPAASRETNRSAAAVVNNVVEASSPEARIEAALDAVRPAIARDGGDVWLVEVRDRVAYVQMIGACGGCAMVHATLKGAIETAVRASCPQIERVEAI